jgi:hypothetical protein
MPIVDTNCNIYNNTGSRFWIPYVGGYYVVDESASAAIGEFMNSFEVNPGQDAILSKTKITSNIRFSYTYTWNPFEPGYDIFKSSLSFSMDIDCPHPEALDQILKQSHDFGKEYAEARYEGIGDGYLFLMDAGLL